MDIRGDLFSPARVARHWSWDRGGVPSAGGEQGKQIPALTEGTRCDCPSRVGSKGSPALVLAAPASLPGGDRERGTRCSGGIPVHLQGLGQERALLVLLKGVGKGLAGDGDGPVQALSGR